MPKTNKDIAEAAVEMAKNVAHRTMRDIDMKNVYDTPAFAELVRFFLTQMVNDNTPKLLND